MKCFVINLPRDIKRRAAFGEAWTAPWPYEVVAAVDGERIEPPKEWKHERGAYGLFATYLWVFTQALRGEHTAPFAVFEDDAMFARDWWNYVRAAVAEVPSGWWSINLGADIEVPGYAAAPVVVSEHVARMPHGWRTHAVVYNPDATHELLAAMRANPIPVDQVWCDLMLKGSRDFYCTRSMLAGSRAGTSTITGIAWDKDFAGPLGLGQPQHRSLAGR